MALTRAKIMQQIIKPNTKKKKKKTKGRKKWVKILLLEDKVDFHLV
jgi:hypothetical protein